MQADNSKPVESVAHAPNVKQLPIDQVAAKDLLSTMKEQTSIIKNDGIVDFAFNPETRKRNETFAGK